MQLLTVFCRLAVISELSSAKLHCLQLVLGFYRSGILLKRAFSVSLAATVGHAVAFSATKDAFIGMQHPNSFATSYAAPG